MRQNDLISFKFSKKGDLWFHAQESPGSHVVLKSSSQAASEQDLQIAADLAALFSKAKRNIKGVKPIIEVTNILVLFIFNKEINKFCRTNGGPIINLNKIKYSN